RQSRELRRQHQQSSRAGATICRRSIAPIEVMWRRSAAVRPCDPGQPEPLHPAAVAGLAKLVPLEALATPKVKVGMLRKAAERGRLRATRAANGTWRSTRILVDEYLLRRWSRGTRPTPNSR